MAQLIIDLETELESEIAKTAAKKVDINKNGVQIFLSDTIKLDDILANAIFEIFSENGIEKDLLNFYIYSTAKGIYHPSELNSIESFIETVKNENGKDVLFTECKNFVYNPWDISQVKNANLIIENLVNQIETFLIEDHKGNKRHLSPLERFLCAFDYVTDFEYKESANWPDDAYLARNPVNILNEGKYIVCVGYSSLLESICDRLSIPSFCQGVEFRSKNNNSILFGSNHQANTIFIEDSIYNIHGVFYSDPCWSSYRRNDKQKRLNFALVPTDDLKKIKDRYVIINDSHFVESFYNKHKVDGIPKNNYQLKQLNFEFENIYSSMLSGDYGADDRLFDFMRAKLFESVKNFSEFDKKITEIETACASICDVNDIVYVTDDESVDSIKSVFDKMLSGKIKRQNWEKAINFMRQEIKTWFLTADREIVEKSKSVSHNTATAMQVISGYATEKRNAIQKRTGNCASQKDSIDYEAVYLLRSKQARDFAKNSENQISLESLYTALKNISHVISWNKTNIDKKDISALISFNIKDSRNYFYNNSTNPFRQSAVKRKISANKYLEENNECLEKNTDE